MLGYVELGREDDGSRSGPLPASAGRGRPSSSAQVAEPKRRKLPLHLDVNPTDRDQDAELERLLAAGARPAEVGQTGEESWHVLADPEGNEFCLLRRRLDPV